MLNQRTREAPSKCLHVILPPLLSRTTAPALTAGGALGPAEPPLTHNQGLGAQPALELWLQQQQLFLILFVVGLGCWGVGGTGDLRLRAQLLQYRTLGGVLVRGLQGCLAEGDLKLKEGEKGGRRQGQQGRSPRGLRERKRGRGGGVCKGAGGTGGWGWGLDSGAPLTLPIHSGIQFSFPYWLSNSRVSLFDHIISKHQTLPCTLAGAWEAEVNNIRPRSLLFRVWEAEG